MNAIDLRATLIIAAIAAAALCAGLIVLLFPLLRRYALARPNARSSHVVPTPQGGGIAVIAATMLVAAALAAMMDFAIPLTLFGAMLVLALVGFADDVRPIPVLPRLALQAAAVAAVLLAAPAELRIFPAWPIAMERGLLLIAGLWFVNLVNFMDGLDLMTVAETVPITGTLVLLGWLGELPTASTVIAAALCGAMLGYAPFNKPVARVFLGDVGSLPIGLLLGLLLLQLAWQQHLAAALLLPLYYLTDATITLLRRMARREPFWAAHRTHFYQRATDHGYTVPAVVAEVFVLNLVLSGLALATVLIDSPIADGVALGIGAIAVAAVLRRFSTRR